MTEYRIWSLLPIAVVIVLAFWTKRTTFALFSGSLIGAMLLWGTQFPLSWVNALYGVMATDLWMWLVLVCGFAGALVVMLESSGSISSFTALANRLCHNDRQSRVGIWFMSILIFIDDWLAILTAGSALKRLSDQHGISRPMLAFLSSNTASCMCTLIPISTWGVFMSSQLVSAGLSSQADSMLTFIKTVPLMFYPIAVLVCSLLYALRVLPPIGPMAKEEREAKLRQCNLTEETENDGRPVDAVLFLLPILIVTVFTIITKEILYGILAGIVVCMAMYFTTGRMKLFSLLDTFIQGFKNMLGVLVLITCAFLLRDINQLLGMPEYIIHLAENLITAKTLPAASFLFVAVLGFVAGNFWGVTAISFPVIIPLALAVGCNPLLAAGSIISGIMASCGACFYGAEASLACSVTEIDNIQYAKTTIPMLVIPFVATLIAYIAIGFYLV